MSEVDLKIIKMYEDGYYVDEIKNECHRSIATIYKILKTNGVKLRSYYRGVKSNLKKEIIERYKQNESIWSLSKSTGLYVNKIKQILNKSGVKSISYSKRLNPNLKEDFFSQIDTPAKAYWLGWLITDGCVTKKNAISLTLQKRDLSILQKFEKDLGLVGKIKVFNSNYYRFSFCCRKMVDDLKKYGIVPNKTMTVRLPQLNTELIPHLLRGCIDGDGGIAKTTSRGKNGYELSFCGNYFCVSDFNQLVSCLTHIKPKNITKNNNIFRVRWSSLKEIEKILQILYTNNDSRYLERKYKFLTEIRELS